MKSLPTFVLVEAALLIAVSEASSLKAAGMTGGGNLGTTDYTCAGEFLQCPGTGDCALFESHCGNCPRGQYLCPSNQGYSASSAECVNDIMSCKHLSGTIWDYTASPETRLNNLVQQSNLTEKIYQLTNAAPAIEHLWVPGYNWLNDDLHGLRRHRATSYPNGNGLGASWDPNLLSEVGKAISEEARALHHYFIERGNRAEPGYHNGEGMTIYGPNINLVRDPRWGRCQETYSEDPCLSSFLAYGYVTGMQNEKDGYKQAAACCKHFAVYDVESDPTLRYFYDAKVDGRNLWETYLPVFEACVRDAKGAHVMCSYNSINGVPACAQEPMINGVLREKWNWTGFVVSDYDAWAQIYETHMYCPNMTCAAWTGINAGMDQEGGGTQAIDQLQAAYEAKKVTSDRIAQSFMRLFRVRLELGMFDPPSLVPFTNYSFRGVISEESHMQLTLKAAKKAISMYKNNNTVLPMDLTSMMTEKKKLAVIGPNAAATSWLQGNYAEHPAWGVVSILEGLFDKFCPETSTPQSFPGLDLHEANDTYVTLSGSNASVSGCYMYCNSQLNCNYWTFESSSNKCWIFRNSWHWKQSTSSQDFTSGGRAGLIPIQADLSYIPAKDEAGVFGYPSHDERECSQRCRASSDCKLFTYSLEAKTCYLLDGKIYNTTTARTASYHYSGSSPTKCPQVSFSEACHSGMRCEKPWGFDAAAKAASEADAVVLVLGLDQQIEAEGHDRTTIDLPAPQYQLGKTIKEAALLGNGAPIVCIFIHGGTMALKELLTRDCDSILDAWYPSQMGGRALADTIFGLNTPGSKATVSSYMDNGDLPPNLAFQNLYPDEAKGLKGYTYRYFNGTMAVPFGFGLSYTTFAASDVSFPKYGGSGITNLTLGDACEELQVEVTVENTGKMEGDEVVQVYIRQLDSAHPVPQLRMVAFSRLTLTPGEKSTVTLSVPPRFRTTILESEKDPILGSQVMIEEGSFELFVGNSQPNLPNEPWHLATVAVPSSKLLDDCPVKTINDFAPKVSNGKAI